MGLNALLAETLRCVTRFVHLLRRSIHDQCTCGQPRSIWTFALHNYYGEYIAVAFINYIVYSPDQWMLTIYMAERVAVRKFFVRDKYRVLYIFTSSQKREDLQKFMNQGMCNLLPRWQRPDVYVSFVFIISSQSCSTFIVATHTTCINTSSFMSRK